MSVPGYRRHLSRMDYISAAQELYRMTTQNCIKACKRYYKYGTEATFAMAQRILENVIKANNTHVINEYEKRTEYLRDALRELACLSNQLQFLILYMSLTDKQWLAWGKQITRCEDSIKIILASDKKRQLKT